MDDHEPLPKMRHALGMGGQALHLPALVLQMLPREAAREGISEAMKTTEKAMQEVIVVTDVYCNRCGQSLKTSCGYEGLVSAVVDCGYESKLGDGQRYEFDVCEDCLGEWFKSFKHDPLARDPWKEMADEVGFDTGG